MIFIHNVWTFIMGQNNSKTAEARRTVCIHLSLRPYIYVRVHLHIYSLISAQMQEQCEAILIKPIRKPPDGCLIKKKSRSELL